jgi:MOSC domain-containing protein YiiM
LIRAPKSAPNRGMPKPESRAASFNPASSLQDLLDAPMRPGKLTWIGLRTERRGVVRTVEAAEFSTESGLIGDRYGGRAGGKRQVTLIAREDLAAAGAFLGRSDGSVPPEVVRRNLVVEGLNIHALKGRRLVFGDDPGAGALIEITGECHPCSRMEEVLGPGGYNAMRGRGGLTARVVRGGTAALGDIIRRAD